MSVRKRSWTTGASDHREAWIVDYVDHGERHIRTFARKKDADAYHASVTVDVAKGIHTPESRSLIVAQAAEQWLAAAALEGLERSTLVQYRVHVRKYIVPHIGAMKLATLTTPAVNDFRDALLRDLNRATARKVLWSFKAIIKDARRRGTIAHNVSEGIPIKGDKRDKKKLEIGRDIPTPDEVRRMLGAAQGSWRALLVVAAFTGLRASELRGLRWSDVDVAAGTVHVRQRADQWGVIGQPRTSTSARAIPVGPFLINTVKEWKLACPKSPGNLVFPADQGRPLTHGNIMYLGYWPAQRAASVFDDKGKPKYPGIHALRHFFASWCINRRADGGLELPIKVVQQRLGHTTITMTADVYGHLFPRGDESEELAAAERALLTPVATNPK
jgi:integrase